MRARSRIATLAAGTLALTGVLVGSGSLSTANATGPVAQPAGTLTLTTLTGSATGDAWSFNSVSQPVGAVPGTCTLTPTTGPLVNLTATSGVPSFATHMIGVNGASWPNYQCARINKYNGYPGQSLTLGLNNSATGALYDPTFGAFLASAATFDLEVTDNSKLKAELLVGGTVVGTQNLYADDSKYPPSIPSGTTYCHLTSTWSRDTYGKKDNCTWSISTGVNFDSVRLTAVAGSFSVEGGGDWGADAANHRTTFSLVKFFDGTTVCDTAITVAGSGNLDGAVLTPLGEESGVECTSGTPYTIDTEGDAVTFHKPSTADVDGQYSIALQRTFANGTLTEFPAPGLIVNWEVPGSVDIPLELCPAGLISATLNPDGTPTGVDLTKVGDDQSDADGTQFACIYNSTVDYDRATGDLTTTDLVWFTGDILLTTKR